MESVTFFTNIDGVLSYTEEPAPANLKATLRMKATEYILTQDVDAAIFDWGYVAHERLDGSFEIKYVDDCAVEVYKNILTKSTGWLFTTTTIQSDLLITIGLKKDETEEVELSKESESESEDTESQSEAAPIPPPRKQKEASPNLSHSSIVRQIDVITYEKYDIVLEQMLDRIATLEQTVYELKQKSYEEVEQCSHAWDDVWWGEQEQVEQSTDWEHNPICVPPPPPQLPEKKENIRNSRINFQPVETTMEITLEMPKKLKSFNSIIEEVRMFDRNALRKSTLRS
jgi:hypothetical protein